MIRFGEIALLDGEAPDAWAASGWPGLRSMGPVTFEARFVPAGQATNVVGPGHPWWDTPLFLAARAMFHFGD